MGGHSLPNRLGQAHPHMPLRAAILDRICRCPFGSFLQESLSELDLF
jgi:hypothetical protein